MATDFTRDSVLHFLQRSGGSVKNSDLLLHFRGFLQDHAERDRNRELFKKFVNSVATVKQEQGASHVVLRKKFRVHVSGSCGVGSFGWRAAELASESASLGQTERREKPLKLQHRETTPVLSSALPSAGLMQDNISRVEVNFIVKKEEQVISSLKSRPGAIQVVHQITEKTQPRFHSQVEPLAQNQCMEVVHQKVGFGPSPGISPVVSVENTQQVSIPVTHNWREASLQTEVSRPHATQTTARCIRHRQSYKTAVSYDEEEDEEEGSARGMWPLGTPLGRSSRATSASLPSIIDQSASVVSSYSSSERKLPHIYIQDMAGELPLCGPGAGLRGQAEKTGLAPEHVPGESMSTQRNLHLDQDEEEMLHHNIHQNLHYPQSEARLLEPKQRVGQRSWLSSCHIPSSDTGVFSSDWPPSGTLRGSMWRNSYDSLQIRAGYLYDELESSDGSTSSPPLSQHQAVARRLSSKLKNRMCRSLGNNLNQLMQEDVTRGAAGGSDAARLDRIHRISSSLSLRYNLSSSSLSSCSTPPSCHSLIDLAEGKEGRRRLSASLPNTHHEGPSRQSLVPLEPKEHAWLVKGAAGAWPDIYSLFREDSSLLNRRDFISGFTVLHWIAKHGDHRVLNTLWYGVQKAGLTFDINARSTCGHTPLHVAAIHNNKNIMCLLVKKFNADVKLRDTAGKKPWQYLSKTAPQDIFQMLGAPLQIVKRGEEGAKRADPMFDKKKHHHRHLHYHLSSASSGEGQLTISSLKKVRRSSSIAAFLKHKSRGRIHGHQSDSSV
ncbi:uncharacterized protein sowahb [Aulostomus maculatus]